MGNAETGLYYYRARYYESHKRAFFERGPNWIRGWIEFLFPMFLIVRLICETQVVEIPITATWPLVGPWIGPAGGGVVTVCFTTGAWRGHRYRWGRTWRHWAVAVWCESLLIQLRLTGENGRNLNVETGAEVF